MAGEKKPIRILQVVTNMDRGGLETMLMNYYRRIDRECVQFDFLTHREQRAAYDDEIESLGGKIYRLPKLVPWSATYKKALDGFFDSHPGYKTVHVHQDCLSSVILKAAKQHGVPVRIAHSHNASQDKNLKYPIKLFYKQFIPKYATHLFACGKRAGEWMFGGTGFVVLPNAIDAEEYTYDAEKRARARKELKIDKDTFVLGHVGRFMPQKNHMFLLDVFAELERMYPDSRLLLVGDGDLRGDIQNKIHSLKLNDKVILTGVRQDIPELLCAMDVFALPSLYEGLGMAAVEAQAAGLPCVVSDGVPAECAVTYGLVTEKRLSETPCAWAEHILSKKETPRTDRLDEVREAGYDIVENAEKLAEFYMRMWGE